MAKRKAAKVTTRRPKRVIRKGSAEENRLADIAAAEEEKAIPSNRNRLHHMVAIREILASLKAAREAAGLSLADMHERTGIARGNLSRMENQKGSSPTLATLERYATAVGCRLEVRVVSAIDP
jgi:DNA-binding Xre family transcriptional regulator